MTNHKSIAKKEVKKSLSQHVNFDSPSNDTLLLFRILVNVQVTTYPQEHFVGQQSLIIKGNIQGF